MSLDVVDPDIVDPDIVDPDVVDPVVVDPVVVDPVVVDPDVVDVLMTNTSDCVIIVYKLLEYVDNNKILILTDKINHDTISNNNSYEIFHMNHDNINLIDVLKSKKYNYIFSEKKISNDNYKFKTYIVPNLERVPGVFVEKLILVPYKYCKPTCVNDYQIMSCINFNNNCNITVEPHIYDSRHIYGSSKIIWAPSWHNISNSHWIIQNINSIGYTHYKRKTNLVDVVSTSDETQIQTFSNDIKNPLNICIYQENIFNPLCMEKTAYFNWFYDTFRNKYDHNINSLYIYQFPFYSVFENILRQRYDLPIDINVTNEYPNCLPLCFNIEGFIPIYRENMNNTNKTCYVLRKTNDTHPLKFMHNIKDYFIHPEDSICIDTFSLQENINMFLECKTFYCYDNTTFLAVIASLCGCNPILMNNYPGICNVREIYKIYAPWMYYGMSYYNKDNSITDGSDTRYLLVELLKKISKNEYKNFFSEKSARSSLLTFLQYLECYFKISFNE
jgi:hypothetical protein